MKRARPSSHTRRIKTRRGIKKIKINRHIKKKVKKIPKSIRKILDFSSIQPIEYGGGIDFENNKFKKMSLYQGESRKVNIPIDYEVNWHTHAKLPGKQQPMIVPGIEDFEDFLNSKQQTMIILKNKYALKIQKTPKFEKVVKQNKLKLKKVYSDFYNSLYSQDLQTHQNEILKILPKLGLNVEMNKPKKEIII